jgi:hypothetical protein
MTFNSIPELQKEGFIGFKKISELVSDSYVIPEGKVSILLFLQTTTNLNFWMSDQVGILKEETQRFIAGTPIQLGAEYFGCLHWKNNLIEIKVDTIHQIWSG